MCWIARSGYPKAAKQSGSVGTMARLACDRVHGRANRIARPSARTDRGWFSSLQRCCSGCCGRCDNAPAPWRASAAPSRPAAASSPPLPLRSGAGSYCTKPCSPEAAERGTVGCAAAAAPPAARRPPPTLPPPCPLHGAGLDGGPPHCYRPITNGQGEFN